MQPLLQDLLFAFRQLRKHPGFALTSILSLALGIGATTAVFSVVYGVLMNPYPYKDPERLVHLVLVDKSGREHWPGFTGEQLTRLQQARSVASIAGMDQWNLTTTGEDLPEDVSAGYFTANAFQHFGVPPLLGREIIPADAPPGQDPQPVVVLSYKFWQRHYGGDRGVIGRRLQLVHKTYTIIGVVPPRFVWGDADVYLPEKLSAGSQVQLGPTTRLKPNFSYAAAASELDAIVQQFVREQPKEFPEQSHARLKGLNDQFVERLGNTLFLLLSAVALLLLIGCGNVSILLLARGTAREHEFAVRAAIGASRVRIVVQLLIESLSLSLAGAVLGVLLAYRAVALIAAWLPEDSFPHEAALEINLPVLLFSIALALLTSVAFGLSPAISFSRPQIAQVIQANTRKATTGVKGKRTTSLLISGQIALTLVLMSAAGAAIGGFLRLVQTGLGYDPHNTMSVGIPVHENTYMTWEQRAAYFEQLRERIQSAPQVLSAGISSNATPPNNGWETGFEIFDKPAASQQRLRANFVSPDYFSVLRIPLTHGRLFNQTETARSSMVAVINETMARRYWPNGDALGRQLRIPGITNHPPFTLAAPKGDTWLQIVGVVADARDDGLRNPVKPAVYVPFPMMMQMFTQILVRTKVPPLSILRSVRAQVTGVNAEQQVFANVRDLDHWISTQPEWAQQRLVASLFGAFAVLALALASVGLYSVVSYAVAQRTNEIGIRMSLGARRNHVLQLVFSSTAISVAIGLAVGLSLSFSLNALLQKVAGGSSRDPVILFAVIALLLTTASAACFSPARRASSVDPMIALRTQ